ncbi:MAG: hypothetical protein ACRBM6_18685 [Geminicoccales bacterium]
MISRRLKGLRSRIKQYALILGAGEQAAFLWQTLSNGFMGLTVNSFVTLERMDGSLTRLCPHPEQCIIDMPGDLASLLQASLRDNDGVLLRQ